MITAELENKLKISKNTYIHCPTLELAKQVLNILHQLGLKWCSENHYTTCTNWDYFKENTIYCPFNGAFSSLEAQLIGYKIIHAEKFIALHTEEKKFDLENYEPKGDLKDFPKEIIIRMLECQLEQWNKIDISMFEKDRTAGEPTKGFVWDDTREGFDFWHEVIRYENFALFFARYPKKEEDSQEFRVGDKVIDIAIREIGIVKNINLKEIISCQLEVAFENCITKLYSLEGKYYNDNKIPMLLHYRDDYNYDVIDFNNLPKRQKSKRWRAKKGETYYSFKSNFKVEDYHECNDFFSNKAYESGNYFKTKEEAQEVADKLNKYFQELINPNKPAVINLINKHGKELII